MEQYDSSRKYYRRSIFNDLSTCMDKSYISLNLELQVYSSLTQAQGQIRLEPVTLNCIKEFIRWKEDEIRIVINTGNQAFPVSITIALNTNYNIHTRFINSSELLA